MFSLRAWIIDEKRPYWKGLGCRFDHTVFTLTPSYSYTGALSPPKYRLEIKGF
ncbi:hypothetical protein VCR20J5_620011 [Vibrio crassostreae]|uniref:Uncharacterized protein n=1 Tax=Vibrio crassostreae TaxID=246167 RepID=A0A822MXR4_9VIBR|nr:hypothetical protein VCR5J5_610001 [Vibrio crassostreae]CDT52930.1 hypothetical protein VCR20J5_620011 [Vibrio crassostreae]